MSYVLRDYQLEAINSIKELQAGENGIISLPTGCHAKGTDILMYDGSIKKVEDICIGDLLMGDDSTPREVLELHRGQDKMYKITPVKGEPFIVNGGHILSLQKTNTRSKDSGRIYPSTLGGSIVNISVEEYINKSDNFKHIHKLYRTKVNFKNAENNLLIDPYLLGLFLGDGSFLYNRINICSPDIEIEEAIYNYAEQYGLEIRKEIQVNNLSSVYHFITHDKQRSKRHSNYLKESLSYLGLMGKNSGEKFIPQEYKITTRENRLKLLAGLLDTDGYMQSNSFEYSTKSYRLKEDVLFLVRSLGLAGYSSTKIVKGNTYYRINISGDCSAIPTRIKRKQARKRNQIKNVLVTGFKVEYVWIDDYYGFTVDKNNLYVMGDFTVTHNSGKTVIMSAIANEIQDRALIVVQSSELREQTIEKLKNTNQDLDIGSVQASLDEVSNKIVIATRQSLTHSKSTRLERMVEYGDFELVFFDEAHQAVGQIRKIVDKLNSNIKVVGLTATPYNEDMRKVFDKIICEKSILEMINKNYLCEPKAKYVYSDTDLSNVKTVAGEFNQRQLEETVNNDNRNNIIVNAYLKYAKDRKSTIVFASGIDHARDISQAFNDSGIKCAYVDSTIEDDKREEIITSFKDGKLPAIVNVGILTTGFDHPSTDCIILARPTKSKILYTQIVGRGLRTAENKDDCLIIDVVDIVKKHDLMTMTDIFNVDIKDGETLSEAIEREKKNEQERIERERVAKEKEQERLRLIAEQIKLFKTNMEDYFEDAYLDWFKCDDNTYALSVFSDYHYVIHKNIAESTFDLYKVDTTNKVNTKHYLSENENLVDLIEEAERYASRRYSTYLDRKAKWKHEDATYKQISWLKNQWWTKGKIFKTKMDVHKITKGNKITWIMNK